MKLIDEKGRLFGVANVVDALVVLVAVALVVAGLALVLGGNGSPTGERQNQANQNPARYATLSYTAPLGSEATTLGANDTLHAVAGEESYNVSDVYRSFTPNGSVYVVAKAEYTGEFSAGGNRLYGGQTTALTTGSYRVAADVHAVNRSRPTIETRQVPVVLTANVSSSVAQALAEGQEATIANHTVATVETVRRGASGDGHRQIWIGVELTAWDRSPVPAFDGKALRVDNRVTLVTDTAVVRGRLHEVGTTEPSASTES